MIGLRWFARARQAGVSRFVVIGSGGSEREARNAVALAKSDSEMFAAVGIHPHDASAVISASLPRVASRSYSEKPCGRRSLP
jgi:Tat protein secretion system quality control protein TatD with DNase activity